MSNEIFKKQAMPLKAPCVEQTGKNNVNVTNNEGGIVNIHYNFPQSVGIDSAEKMKAIQSFSREYYHLLVTMDEDVFNDNVVELTTDRSLKAWGVPPEIYERCSSLSEEAKEELKTFPALICMENTEMYGRTDPRQVCVYAYIRKIKKDGRYIKIAFETLGTFFQSKLCDKKNAIFFDLDMEGAITTLNHSAWTIHKTNLFEAFDEADISNMPRPMQ